MDELKVNCLVCKRDEYDFHDNGRHAGFWTCGNCGDVVTGAAVYELASLQQRVAELEELETAAILFMRGHKNGPPHRRGRLTEQFFEIVKEQDTDTVWCTQCKHFRPMTDDRTAQCVELDISRPSSAGYPCDRFEQRKGGPT